MKVVLKAVLGLLFLLSAVDIPDYLDGYDLRLIANGQVKRVKAISEEFHVMRRAMIRGTYNGINYLFSMRIRPEGFIRGKDMNWIRTAPNQLDIHLFDLDKDSDEINNLADKKKYQEAVSYFKKRVIERMFAERVESQWIDQISQSQAYSEK